jgi:ABC-type transport system involved in cytochrome c biogenesis permease subunit
MTSQHINEANTSVVLILMKTRILAILTVVAMIPALYMIFLFAPTEATQGNAQRIFYIHVPLAIIGAYGSAILLFIGCLGFLITRNLKWDRFAACSAEMGVIFTAAQLLTAMMGEAHLGHLVHIRLRHAASRAVTDFHCTSC